MRKLITSAFVAATLLTSPVLAGEEEITKGWFTDDAKGCMLLRECTKGVDALWGVGMLKEEYPMSNWDVIGDELTRMLLSLTAVNVNVYLADAKYFPISHRGVYHVTGNNFFLNRAYMHRPEVLMTVMRHEGWHAAQDCMAGTIDNTFIAIIKEEDEVPPLWREIVEKTYPPNAVPWEAEAKWAGKTEGMTMKALEACAAGEMWNVYTPTAMTKEWLVENGYMEE